MPPHRGHHRLFALRLSSPARNPSRATPANAPSTTMAIPPLQGWLPDGLFSDEAQAADVETAMSGDERGRLNEVLGMYFEGLDVSPVPDSQLIQISFDSTDPVLAAEVPNTLAEAYIERHIQSRTDITQDAVGWMTARPIPTIPTATAAAPSRVARMRSRGSSEAKRSLHDPEEENGKSQHGDREDEALHS